MLPRLTPALSLALALAACAPRGETAETTLFMAFDDGRDLFAAPFPSEHRRRADGSIDVSLFPNPAAVRLVDDARSIVGAEARGFSTTAGVFFRASAALDPAALPTIAGSVRDDAPVFLAELGVSGVRRVPIEVAFADDAGPFGGGRLLSLLPVQGFPLRPGATYAAVVLRRVGDRAGAALGMPNSLRALAAGRRPRGLGDAAFGAYLGALAALQREGIASSSIAGLAVFTTEDPRATFAGFASALRARPLPAFSPFARREVFPSYCVYTATIPMPVYQGGAPPYLGGSGGDWRVDPQGLPAWQRDEVANVVVTIPRRTAPLAGFPAVVLVRTGAGGDRPLVDRGPRDGSGASLEAGTGPALHFARAGYAGLSIDGPLGGRRNPTGGDEQILIFNFNNARALRDNVRQSALELLLAPSLLEGLALDASDCPGARAANGSATLRFDATKLGLFGHSMGASIAPLTLAFEPRYGAAILSGAGGSWIENVRYKRKPLDVRQIAELLLGYAPQTLSASDPVLSLVQWAAEGADAQVYVPALVRAPEAGSRPRHVLMLQGMVDHYILPRIANAASLALGLDRGGAALDDPARLALRDPSLAEQLAFDPLAALAGRRALPLPISSNVVVADGPSARAGVATAVLVQHAEDGIEDGHEVAFQVPAARRQYRCFLDAWRTGAPKVVAPLTGAAANDDAAPCE